MDKVKTAAAAQQIRARYDLFEKFFAKGDIAGLVDAYYVREPLVSAPDAPLLRDLKSVETLFGEFAKVAAAVRFESVELRQSGDLAYELGRAFLTMRDATATETQARYMVVWRQTAAGWRAEADFFAFGNLI
jgi:ketosteroid isomerase-like protein